MNLIAGAVVEGIIHTATQRLNRPVHKVIDLLEERAKVTEDCGKYSSVKQSFIVDYLVGGMGTVRKYKHALRRGPGFLDTLLQKEKWKWKVWEFLCCKAGVARAWLSNRKDAKESAELEEQLRLMLFHFYLCCS